jgi:hypothetical protein
LFVSCAAAVYIIRQFLRNSKSLKEKVKDSKVKREKHSVVQRLVLSHLQILGLVSKFNLRWPPAVETVFSVSSTAASFNVFEASLGGGVECLLRPSTIAAPIFKLLLSVVSIILTVVTVHIYWNWIHPRVLRCFKKPIEIVETKALVQKQVLMSVIALLYMMYSSFASAFFALFSCTGFEGEGNTRRLRNGLDMVCFESEHLLWLSGLGAPFGKSEA